MSEEQNKTEWLHIRVSPTEKAAVEAAAKAAERKVSDLARLAIKAGLGLQSAAPDKKGQARKA